MRRGATRAVVSLSLAIASLGSTAALARAASTYYVAPEGPRNTPPCAQAEPCYLGVPLTKGLEAGDTVILAPGEYQGPPQTPMGVTINLLNEHVTVEGEPGKPAPRIFSKVSGGPAVRLEGFEALLESVVVEDSGIEDGWSTLIATGGRVDHAILRSTTSERPACTAYEVAIVDSVCAGKYGFYLSTFGGPLSIELRNSVLYGTEFGMWAGGTGPLDLKIGAVNSVIRAAPGGHDIEAAPLEAAGVVHLDLEHSNFGGVAQEGSGETVVTGGANQSAAPLFANIAGGDFREAPGSPTIDAGLDSPLNGLTDLSGNPREIGSHTDIGAYEFLIPPAAETGAASAIGQTAATLTGTVNPNGLAGSVEFRYGTSAAYGSTVALTSPGAVTTPIAMSAALRGLSPGTTYHYELLATNAEGTSGGGDRTFTTASPSPASGPGGPPPAPKPVLSGLRISPSSLRAAAHGRRHAGATVAFTLSESVQVSFAIQQSRPGRRGRGGRCVAPGRSNRTSRPCRRTVTVLRFSRSGRKGANRFHFTGGGLRRGSYVLVAAPRAGALAGAAERAGFRVTA